MTTRFETYLLKLRETPIGEHTEHTGRSALEALLNEFGGGGITVQHEPKREFDAGAAVCVCPQGGGKAVEEITLAIYVAFCYIT